MMSENIIPLSNETLKNICRNTRYALDSPVAAHRFLPRGKDSGDPQVIARLVHRLVDWYKAWCPILE